MKSGKNVFLTGSAGTGKTYVLNRYIRYLKERKVPVSITASTGIAATHLEGTTIHAWSGIGIRDKLSMRNLRDMKEKKYLKKNIEKTRVLLIDEISMLHKKQFGLVDEVLRYFRETDEAFGGLQLIVSGDFFQLPPVGDPSETNRDKFCFMSDAWLAAGFTVCYLTEQFRQTDNRLDAILNEIRGASISSDSLQQLQMRREAAELSDPTRLYTHNQDVDRINTEHLRSIKGPKRSFKAQVKGNLKLAETVKKSIMAPENLELKKNARVMFVRNNYEKGYLNGTLGRVLRFDSEGFPVVQLDNGYEITASPEDWRLEDESGKLLLSYSQVPLRLAWAITVHKSQGMTLDAAVMDLSNTFEKGQGYVALSRVKSLEGLVLEGFNQTTLQVDGLALRADRRFIELSGQVEAELDEAGLERMAQAFIEQAGGVLDPEEILENRKNLEKGKKVKKRSTYLTTKKLIDQGNSLQDIAIQRDLSTGTVITHLLRIADQYPDTDLSRFRPDDATIRKVSNARKKLLGQSGNPDRVSLKPIFEILKGELSYEQIKLALVFV